MSVSDLKRQYLLDNTGLSTGTLTDLEWSFFSSQSGLTPASYYSVADHKRKFLENKTGLSGVPMRTLEKTWFALNGTPDGAYGDMANSFYDFDPFKLANLEFAVDAARPLGITPLANLLSYNSATFEGSVGEWISDSATLTLATSTAWAASGTTSMAITKTANLEVASTVLPLAYTKVVPGRTYSAHSTWRTANISRFVQMTFAWRDANFNVITSVSGTKPADTTTSDVVASIEAVAPAGAASVMIYMGVFVPSTAAGEIHYVDKIGLYESSLPAAWIPPGGYTDGNFVGVLKDLSGKGRDVVQPDGPQQPIYRTISKNLLTYNQATVEIDMTGLKAVYNCTASRNTANFASGTASLAGTATSPLGFKIGITEGMLAIPVKPNQPLTATVKIKTSVPRLCLCQLSFYDANGSSIGPATVNGTYARSSTTDFTQYTAWTSSTPSNAAYASVGAVVDDPTCVIGDIMYADEFGLWYGPNSDNTWVRPVTLPNGLPTIQFDGANDQFYAFTSIGGPRTIYTVGYNNASGAPYAASMSKGNTSILYGTVMSDGNTIGILRDSANTSINLGNNGGAVAREKTGVRTVVLRNKGMDVSNNGILTSQDNPALLDMETSDTLSIGAPYPNSTFQLVEGAIAAVLIFSGAHNDATRKRVEKWLGAKYGVAVAG